MQTKQIIKLIQTKKNQENKTLGSQHFVTVQWVLDDKQFVCVKCGQRAYDIDLLLGQQCKISTEEI